MLYYITIVTILYLYYIFFFSEIFGIFSTACITLFTYEVDFALDLNWIRGSVLCSRKHEPSCHLYFWSSL